MSLKEETEWKVYRDSQYHRYNFFISLKLFLKIKALF